MNARTLARVGAVLALYSAGHAVAVAPPERGRYGCSAAAGIAGTLTLEITGLASYAGNGKPGRYEFDPDSGKLRFTSGPWEGFYGKNLQPGKIGVTSRPGGSYMTVCNRK